MLDADDWMYPWRLQAELDFLDAVPMAAIVSAGMAIVDGAGELVGVRGYENSDKPQLFPPMMRLRMPPFGFPQSMIRTRIAKLSRFDPQFRAAEDVDFMMPILLQHGYGILNRIVYAYTESSTVTLQKLMLGNRFTGQMFRKQRVVFPLQSRLCNIEVFAKSLVYRGACVVNRSEWLVRRRSRPPTLTEREEFHRAHATVALKVEEIFTSPVPV
jgi:hypothetical protein